MTPRFIVMLRSLRDTISVASCAMVRFHFDAPWRPAPPCGR